ncbi:hypothetical protein EIN_252470 [Entamoeba invadens IP1]|uniref:LytTR family transcriptional regulator n=1 Tax=Entamoeba invadens IP1 TaxID=370355 RepID=A0A0A1UEX9_ENTIV|nr:hypothetical protein EIN_252470 [Entamoeba invadens IP1]ELP95023.1 hypothetical protein EIN_252470 [Entamoeba invadens IP1]|eukprot:XP_004261794.1 hypothetical protein EIN_252470 [Entamoeba invadens IP1]
MVFQQALLIALANQFCGFTIETPTKMAQITETLPNIIKMQAENDLVDVIGLAETQAKQLLQATKHTQISVKEKSLQRRIKKNITYFTQNLLIDFCIEHGYFFNSIYSKKSQKTFQVERVQEIFFGSTFLMRKNTIQSVGGCVNEYLLTISHGKTVFLRKNDDKIKEILEKNIPRMGFL